MEQVTDKQGAIKIMQKNWYTGNPWGMPFSKKEWQDEKRENRRMVNKDMETKRFKKKEMKWIRKEEESQKKSTNALGI